MKISITDFNPMDPSECFQVYNMAAAAAAYFGADNADQIVRGAKTAPQDSGLVADIQETDLEEADELPPVYLRTPVSERIPEIKKELLAIRGVNGLRVIEFPGQGAKVSFIIDYWQKFPKETEMAIVETLERLLPEEVFCFGNHSLGGRVRWFRAAEVMATVENIEHADVFRINAPPPAPPAESSVPAPQEEPPAPAESSVPAPQEEPPAPAESSVPAPKEEPSAPAESSVPAPQEEPEEPPPPPLPRAREVMEPPEVEAHVKEVKKPRSKPRPERAKVFEAPGECLHCGLVACTDVGWFCKPQFRGLPVDAKKCKKFTPGKPEGMSEPEPPPEPPAESSAPAQQTPPTPAAPPAESSAPAQQTTPTPAAPPAESSAPAQQTPPPAAPPAESSAPAQQTPPAAAAAPVDDPEAFFNQNPDDGMDAKTMRDTIRRQARECLQNPEIRKTFPTFIRQFTETGQINDIPDDKLKPCLTALRQAAADAGKKGGQGNLAV